MTWRGQCWYVTRGINRTESRRILRKAAQQAIRAGDEDLVLTCRNKPEPSCGFGAAGEYADRFHLIFAPDTRQGLVLEAIYVFDENAVTAEFLAEQRRFAARHLARFRASACPPTR